MQIFDTFLEGYVNAQVLHANATHAICYKYISGSALLLLFFSFPNIGILKMNIRL